MFDCFAATSVAFLALFLYRLPHLHRVSLMRSLLVGPFFEFALAAVSGNRRVDYLEGSSFGERLGGRCKSTVPLNIHKAVPYFHASRSRPQSNFIATWARRIYCFCMARLNRQAKPTGWVLASTCPVSVDKSGLEPIAWSL
jgi:hypothetical protein